MSNPAQRDDVYGTAASASAEYYREHRKGNLMMGSDGLRSPTLARSPRFPPQEGYKPDPPLRPYAYNPASPPGAPFPRVPRMFAYLRAADLGAPRVGRPDAARTDGKLQPSGQAWGRVGEQARATMQPPTDGTNAPPTHTMGARIDSEFLPRSHGPRWQRPDSPRIFDHLPH